MVLLLFVSIAQCLINFGVLFLPAMPVFTNSFLLLFTNSLLIIFGLHFIVQNAKNTLKNIISPVFKKERYPEKIDPKDIIDNSTYDFNNRMKELGSVTEYGDSSKNIVVAHDFLCEFLSLPCDVLNIYEGQQKAHRTLQLDDFCIISQKKGIRNIGEMFSRVYLYEFIRAEGKDYIKIIQRVIRERGISTESGLIKIEDVSYFLVQIVFENACLRIFGKTLVKKKEFQDYLEGFSYIPHLQRFSKYNPLEILRFHLAKRKYRIQQKKLAEIIKSELNVESKVSAETLKEPCAIKILKTFKLSEHGDSIIKTASILQRMFGTYIALLPTVLLNILVDISVQPDLYSSLVHEQKEIMKLYGKCISMSSVMLMDHLDEFITESLLLSSPASFMHRQVKKDVALSNGTTIKEGSLLSLNLFSKYHCYKESRQRYRRFDPSRHIPISKGSNVPSKKSLIWGYGARACPFDKYAFAQIKIIIAIFLRKYKVYASKDGFELNHPGYQDIDTVIPNTNHIYLKRHKI